MTPPLKIATWVWGTKYNADYVRRWRDGINRNLRQPHDLLIFSPDDDTRYLTEIKGCFCRLKMFSPEWQEKIGLETGERLVCTDLDVVFTGPLDPLFDRPEEFVILGGANALNPCDFNGSLMMLRGGSNHQIWSEFSVEKAKKQPFFEFADDQQWLFNNLPSAATWRVGKSSGIYSFQKRGWPGNDILPEGARCVVFPGWRDPSRFLKLEWIRENWS